MNIEFAILIHNKLILNGYYDYIEDVFIPINGKSMIEVKYMLFVKTCSGEFIPYPIFHFLDNPDTMIEIHNNIKKVCSSNSGALLYSKNNVSMIRDIVNIKLKDFPENIIHVHEVPLNISRLEYTTIKSYIKNILIVDGQVQVTSNIEDEDDVPF